MRCPDHSLRHWQMPTTPISHGCMVRVALGGWRAGDNGVVRTPNPGVPVMKTIVSALIALSVLSGFAASANAWDAKSFFEELDRTRT